MVSKYFNTKHDNNCAAFPNHLSVIREYVLELLQWLCHILLLVCNCCCCWNVPQQVTEPPILGTSMGQPVSPSGISYVLFIIIFSSIVFVYYYYYITDIIIINTKVICPILCIIFILYVVLIISKWVWQRGKNIVKHGIHSGGMSIFHPGLHSYPPKIKCS